MKTERAQELLSHFKAHGISQEPGNGLNMVLEYQDIIGHSTTAEIRDFEADLDQASRKNFVWVNFLTLSQDTALDIFKSTVASRWLNKQADILEDDYNEKLTDVYARERTLKEGKRAIYKKITKLEAENARLRSKLEFSDTMKESAWSNNKDLLRSVSIYKDKAQKFDSMKALLA
jgi:hypothetical protein